MAKKTPKSFEATAQEMAKAFDDGFPTRPIKPSEVDKTQVIPGVVFQCFNQLIARNINMNVATIGQKEIVQLLIKNGIKEKDIWKKKYLDVEDAYRSAGWKVEYDKPGYDESYEPTFKFSAK